MAFGSFISDQITDQVGGFAKDQISGFGSGFSKGFFGSEYVKDYTHASKIFASDGYALAPNNKFLFHVYFTLNTAQIPSLANAMGSAADSNKLGILVKSVRLPSFDLAVEEFNQYNRKRLIQKKINYRPVDITLHDDGSDLIRSMWYNYYSYYYQDANYSYGTDRGNSVTSNNASYNPRDIYENLRSVNDWGYTGASELGESKPAFFRDIKIYGLNRGNFVSYTLINPMITSWAHDTYDYSASDVMQNSMTLQYEAVKYERGKLGSEVKGFGEPALYDTSRSALSSPGATDSLLGQGGIMDAGTGIVNDLSSGNILGAVQKAGTFASTFKNANLSNVASAGLINEMLTQSKNVVAPRIADSIGGFSFPTGASNTDRKLLNTRSDSITTFKNLQADVGNPGFNFIQDSFNTPKEANPVPITSNAFLSGLSTAGATITNTLNKAGLNLPPPTSGVSSNGFDIQASGTDNAFLSGLSTAGATITNTLNKAGLNLPPPTSGQE